MKIVEFLDPKKNYHIIRPSYLKEFYNSLNYIQLPENKLLKKIIVFFYTVIMRKIKIYFNFLFYVKFIFENPKKKSLVILDDESFFILSKAIQNENFVVIPSRIERIKHLYLTRSIIKSFLKNFTKTSLKISYLSSLIECIEPRSVITFIDNSYEFSNIVKILKNSKIRFSAIQNSHRASINYKKTKINAHNYYVFGNYEKKLLNLNSSYKGNITPVGSLTAAVAKDQLYKKHKFIKENVYDICFISEPHYKFNSDFSHIHKERNYNVQENVRLLANYVLKFCKNNNKKLIFSGKADVSSHFKNAEILSYKNMIKDYDFEISFHKKNDFENYKNLINSKLIIGMNSTILREAFEFKRKVLWCNLVDHIDTQSPSEGICEFKSKTYEAFEERVLKILNISFDEYLKEIKNVDNFYNMEINTLEYLRKELILQ